MSGASSALGAPETASPPALELVELEGFAGSQLPHVRVTRGGRDAVGISVHVLGAQRRRVVRSLDEIDGKKVDVRPDFNDPAIWVPLSGEID